MLCWWPRESVLWGSSALIEFLTSLSKVLPLWHSVKVKQFSMNSVCLYIFHHPFPNYFFRLQKIKLFFIALIFLENSPKLFGNEMSPLLALSKKFKAPLAFGTSVLYQFQEIKFSGMAGISEIIWFSKPLLLQSSRVRPTTDNNSVVSFCINIKKKQIMFLMRYGAPLY